MKIGLSNPNLINTRTYVRIFFVTQITQIFFRPPIPFYYNIYNINNI